MPGNLPGFFFWQYYCNISCKAASVYIKGQRIWHQENNMIPEKNGIYIRNLSGILNGDIISVPKALIGDPNNPEGKDLNCNWAGLEFFNGIAKANALDANTMKKKNLPEYFNINKLLKYSKTPGLKVFLVNNLVGSDPEKEASLFLKRFSFITERSALGGVIVHITSEYAKRTANSARVYMDAINACGMTVGFWGDAGVPDEILKVFISKTSFVMGNVSWKPDERPYTSLVQSYLYWTNLGARAYIPVVNMFSSGTYKYKKNKVLEYHTSLMQTDLNANMWYLYDPLKTQGTGVDANMDVRSMLHVTPWSKPIVTPVPPPDTTNPVEPPPANDPADELTLEQKVAILWQDYLERSKKAY